MVEMNVQEVLKQLTLKDAVDVEHSDIMSASPEMADLFICGRDLEENAARLGDVLILDNILDKAELEGKLIDKFETLDVI
ncbi:hypothetical protein SPSINT_2271 [Staphylococcus pseudintermedius HKU10-03]|nr:hypothetical protein SPSINT_2271 [Staphylococcus pseudintermedius HKU10-03]ANS88453.1 hypothetical protein A6M57_0670 [Staphylococcus pseudintermedius]